MGATSSKVCTWKRVRRLAYYQSLARQLRADGAGSHTMVPCHCYTITDAAGVAVSLQCARKACPTMKITNQKHTTTTAQYQKKPMGYIIDSKGEIHTYTLRYRGEQAHCIVSGHRLRMVKNSVHEKHPHHTCCHGDSSLVEEVRCQLVH